MFGKTAMQIIEKLEGERIAGTRGAREAEKLITRFIKSEGIRSKREYFHIQSSDTQLSIIRAGRREFECLPLGLAVPFTVQGKLLFLHSSDDCRRIDIDLKNRIMLTRNKPKPKDFPELKERGLKGIIVITRTDNLISSSHLSHWMIEKNCIIPGATVSYETGLELIKYNDSAITIKGRGSTKRRKTANIIADIKGRENTDETIIIMGHYDTVPLSPGASDNGGGTGIIAELIEYFNRSPVRRNLRFIFFSGEEWGLWGSRHYCSRHKKELKNVILGINIDVAGDTIGSDFSLITANKRLVHTVKDIADYEGMHFNIQKSIYSSDNMPFAFNFVPTVSFGRARGKSSSYIHTNSDNSQSISPEGLNNTISIAVALIERTGNARVNIVERAIDSDIRDKIIDYFKDRGIGEESITGNLPYAKTK
ncbi:MAG: M20/M25/M40 family metallo-hydrolase [bacterium]